MTIRPPHDSVLLEHPSLGTVFARQGDELVIAVATQESTAVARAVAHLAKDLNHVVGASVSESSNAEFANVIVGTVGISPAVDDAVARGLLDLTPLRDPSGELYWEGFLVILVLDTLYLVGTDRRGTVYAVYHFAELIGVSPWYWWGDVAVPTREHITLPSRLAIADWPSVRYRGIFINDEEELDHWAKVHTADGAVGPETYARLFELILRLKGNYLWPAMHVGAFNTDPANGRLAHDMGLVIGSSHCDILLRSNEHEFEPWEVRQDVPVSYDYSFTGSNRERLRDYWRDSVKQNREYDVTWTVGMRGIHDSGFETAAIDASPGLSEEQKIDARVELLNTVIADQRALLSETLGTPPDAAPQIFIPYKEVLDLYDRGLRVPEDVTLVWANDNFGYLRRFPNDAELARSGGHGLYYHSSYWSTPTTSYLATSSTPLALMRSQLSTAWDRGIRKLWVNNVGGLKPLELEMEFFLRSAWEAGKESSTLDVRRFTARWLDAKLSGGIGQEASDIYARYYQLNNQRKYEHLVAGAFPQVGYGDEAGRRLTALEQLHLRTCAILDALPAQERDSFFELFAIKIEMAYLVNAEFYYADRSALAYRQGKQAAADRYLELSRTFDGHKRALIHFYNHVMCDGAWSGMFTPATFPPPVMPLHPAGAPALSIKGSGVGVIAWGEPHANPQSALVFSAGSLEPKWIELFSTGVPSGDFSVEADPWIDVVPSSGPMTEDTRLRVTVRNGAPTETRGSVRVHTTNDGPALVIRVEVSAPKLPDGFIGWTEADGYISLDPSVWEKNYSAGGAHWVRVPDLGRYLNDALVARGSHTGPVGEGGWVEHHVCTTTSGVHLLELHRLPTLDATGRIRIGVQVDDFEPVVMESPTTDEHRGAWASGIQDNVERLTVRLPALEAGAHRLRLYVVDAGFTLSKVVIYTGVPLATNLGPDFSRHTGRPVEPSADADPARVDIEPLRALTQTFYRTDPDLLAPADQLYAGDEFWNGDTTFRPSHAVTQTHGGTPRYRRSPDGSKDVISEFGDGVFLEREGVLAIEAEFALAQSTTAWHTAALDSAGVKWEHTQAETDGRTGLAMQTPHRGGVWTNPEAAPALNYRIAVSRAGKYRAWMLVKFEDRNDDSCLLSLDGRVQSADRQFSGGELCTYGNRQVWLWAAISDLEIDEGEHVLSVIARKAGLRVDRVYLTLGEELPPVDSEWMSSPRGTSQTEPSVSRFALHKLISTTD